MGGFIKYDIVIPCAGRGSRLKQFTKKNTKNLIRIGNQSLLDIQIKSLLSQKNKINKIIFIIGYEGKKLKKYILSLKLPFRIEFINNERFVSTQCAYSLYLSLNKITKKTIFINSDFLFNNILMKKITSIKKNNFFLVRKKKNDEKKRPVKVLIKDKKVIKISLSKKNYNFELVGPFVLPIKSIKKLIIITKKIKPNVLDKLSCFEYLGLLIDHVNFNYYQVKDRDWFEINDIKEYEKFLRINKNERNIRFTY